MKIRIFVLFACIAFVLLACSGEKVLKKTDLKEQTDQVSYIFGYDIGKNFQGQNIEVNIPALTQGIKDGLKEGDECLLTQDEIQTIMMAFQQEMQEKTSTDRSALGEKNLQEGTAFLQANGEKEGVVTLESGLQYKILEAGEGSSPQVTDRVKTHYRGTLIDGTEFDNSMERGEPIEFMVNGVISGWTEALQLMKVGSKWQLFVPPELGYGANGAGELIGPNAVLIFEVELISIEK